MPGPGRFAKTRNSKIIRELCAGRPARSNQVKPELRQRLAPLGQTPQHPESFGPAYPSEVTDFTSLGSREISTELVACMQGVSVRGEVAGSLKNI